MPIETNSPGDPPQPHHEQAAFVAPPSPPPVSQGALRNQPASRGQFIAWIAMAPVAWAAVAMLRRVRERNQPAPVSVPSDVPVGLSVAGELVLNRGTDGSVRAFAARCTHLGCRLERVIDGVIVCGCHGSRFHADGSVATGPAARPLSELRVSPNAQTGGWTVYAD